MAQMERDNIFILGETRDQAGIFARWLGLDKRHIISDLRHLEGIARPTVLLVGSWRRKREVDDQIEGERQRGVTFLEVTDLR